MKRNRRSSRIGLCLTAAAVVLTACAGGDGRDNGSPAVADEEAAFPDAIRRELVQLGEADQALRRDLTGERMQDSAFAMTMLRDDSIRTARLRQIVRAHGWPDTVRAGPDAAGAAFLILQHSPDHAFQREMLPVLEDLAAVGRVSRSETAMLIDRVRMHQSLPQRYGTQFQMVDDRWALYPVEDEAGLEERRRAMELPTMAEYMRIMSEYYGVPAARAP